MDYLYQVFNNLQVTFEEVLVVCGRLEEKNEALEQCWESWMWKDILVVSILS